MHFVDRHREKIRQSPMSSRLLWACLLLVVLLVLTFGAALFLFASLHNTKKDTIRSLRRTSCSGAFVLLDATVNTRMEGAEHSRAGLYVQKSGADTPTVPLLLYRGSAEVGKARSVMPHRKWRMEFQTDQFPDYDRWMTPSSTQLYQAYTLTERFSLPGTSEEVQLFLLPLRGRDGTMYGLCGFEISQSFFKQNFVFLPSKLLRSRSTVNSPQPLLFVRWLVP